jgi:hypothetical protein
MYRYKCLQKQLINVFKGKKKPDCWLEVCLHQEGPAIKVFLGPGANADLLPKFYVILHSSHAAPNGNIYKFRPNVALHRIKFSFNAAPIKPHRLGTKTY